MDIIKLPVVSKPNEISNTNRFYHLDDWNKAIKNFDGPFIPLFIGGSGSVLISCAKASITGFILGKIVSLDHILDGYIEVEPVDSSKADIIKICRDNGYKAGYIMRAKTLSKMEAMTHQITCLENIQLSGYELSNPELIKNNKSNILI